MMIATPLKCNRHSIYIPTQREGEREEGGEEGEGSREDGEEGVGENESKYTVDCF